MGALRYNYLVAGVSTKKVYILLKGLYIKEYSLIK